MFTKTEFTRLAEKHKDAVFRLAYSLLKNPADADDVVQNTLLRLYQSNKRFDGDERSVRIREVEGSNPFVSTKWTLDEHLLFSRRFCRDGAVPMKLETRVKVLGS